MMRGEGSTITPGGASRTAALAALLLVAACLLHAGCGKKEWPSPRTEKDRFTWSSVRASRDGSCLVIRGELDGAAQNLSQVVLQVEKSEELCPGCPFTPDSSTVYTLRDPSLSREGSSVIITHCPVEQDTAIRLRLDGINVFRQIPEASSGLVELKAQNATQSKP
jgi:hypothetical protein